MTTPPPPPPAAPPRRCPARSGTSCSAPPRSSPTTARPAPPGCSKAAPKPPAPRTACPPAWSPPYTAAALYLALASGYQPLDTADPVIGRALDELPGYPPERQARLLTYAARRAGTT